MCTHIHARRYTPLYRICTKCPNKPSNQAAGSSLFLFVCYKLAFGLNGAWDALKARREDNLSPGLICYQSRRLKWVLLFFFIFFGRGGNEGGMEGKKEHQSPLPLFSETRGISKQAVKTATCKCAHTYKQNSCQCAFCNINVQKRVWISDWKAGAFAVLQ